MHILRRHQLRDQKIRQARFAERVSKLKVFGAFGIERSLQLERPLSDPSIVYRVLFVVLRRGRQTGSPSRISEVRVLIQERQAPIEGTIQSAETQRLRLAPKIIQRVLEIDPRPLKRLLAGFKVRR